MKKILYYSWNENSQDDICKTFENIGYKYKKVCYELGSYSRDEKFEEYFKNMLIKDSYDAIFTLNFFPVISKVAQKSNISYVSWIYDNPHYTLYSDELFNSCNKIFFFDKGQFEYFKGKGLENGYHQPLAVNTSRLKYRLGDNLEDVSYLYDVSFVGSMYEDNLYNSISYLPEYIVGFLDGVIESQRKIYGYNLVNDIINDELVERLNQYLNFTDDEIKIPRAHIYANMLHARATELDRKQYINNLANYFDVHLFTGSKVKMNNNVKMHNYVNYKTEMPKIFRNTKINLNISLRSISTGIPLRAMDILGAGGFLLSNYQRELAEYFSVGEEIELFDSEIDLINKVDWYLKNEEKRIDMVKKSYQKIKDEFSYEIVMKNIFDKI